MNWKQEVVAAIGFAVLAMPSYAQMGSQTTSPNATGDTRTDTSTSPKMGGTGDMGARGENRQAMLLGFIHHANQGEIEMANLAKNNASSSRVKDFADRIIKDHRSADEQVQTFAKNHNIDLTAMHRQMSGIPERQTEQQSRAVGSATGDSAEHGTGGARMDHEGMGHMGEHKAAMDKLRSLKGAEFDREFVRTMVNDHQKVIDRLTNARSRISDADTQALIDKLLPTLREHLSTAQKLQDDLLKS